MAAGKSYVLSSFMIGLSSWSLIPLILLLCVSTTFAQSSPIRTNMPVPPLQWLNLTGLTSGPAPQPLSYSSIGYDEATRSLIIFGGESQAGFPQQSTYLLDMDSLTWSTPSSRVPQFSSSPPPRSRALGTGDFAANSRRDFLVYGGKGPKDEAISDVWAYDFLNQFWINISTIGTPPSPRWGTVGGIDPASVANSGNNVSTVFNIIGGSDSNTIFPIADFWQLNVTGTLASDLTSIQGVWQELSLPSRLAGKAEAGGALISQSQATNTRIVVSGGCGSNANPLNATISCVDATTDVLTVSPSSSFSPPQCPAPRLGPVLVPNLSTASSSFLSQVFLLLGTFDLAQWNDDGGLAKGEVAVLDVSAGTWARVLPAGDPASGTITFPPPREGAAALSFPSALVGQNRAGASDTIVFGGRDAEGGYTNDLWILRAYNGSIARSGDHWSGFGNGKLETGISASGSGVSLTYLSQCANSIKPTPTTTTSSSSVGETVQTSPGASPITTVPLFDVSIVHKLLSTLSIVFALVATVLVRLSLPSLSSSVPIRRSRLYWYLGIFVALAAYGLGIAGFATSLTSTTRSSSSLQRRSGTSPDTFVKTVHGRAGFALCVGLYGVVPVLYIVIWLNHRTSNSMPGTSGSEDGHGKTSEETGPLTGEKELLDDARSASPARSAPEVHSTESSVRVRRQRAQSGPGLLPGWKSREASEVTEPGPSRGFEVINRPRRASGGMILYPHSQDYPPRPRDLMRSLNDMSWLDRRRSVSAVGELDYALSQLDHTSPRSMSPPITSRPPTVTMSNRPFVRTPTSPVLSSSPKLACRDVFMHIMFHAFLLGNCILVLVALFSRAPIATFVVFLIWTLAFYLSLFLLAWNGRPQASILTIAFARLRVPSTSTLPPSPTDEPPMDERESHVSPSPGSSPYVYHQPPWRRAVSPEEDLATRTSHGRPTSDLDEPDDDDDDEDESERQRRMEEELERRDVNIVTVPRRKLWITNPS